MQISVLGPLRVDADSGPVTIRSAIQQNLLAVLLVHVNQPIPADSLVHWVWGAVSPGKTTANLRVHLHHLRRLLGAEAISHEPGGYRLVIDAHDVDAQRFRDGVDRARRSLSDGLLHESHRTFHDSLRLWRGSAYSTCRDPQPVAREAAALDALRLDAQEELLGVDIELGRYAEASATATALAAANPLRESLHEKAMRGLYLAGRSADALTLYERFRQGLRAELGVDPGSSLRLLYQQILRGELRSAGDDRVRVTAPAAPAPVPSSAEPASPAQLPAPTGTLVGRDAELRKLDQLGSVGSAATAPPVALIGPAGVGKTALLLHWADRVRPSYPDGQLFMDLSGFGPAAPLPTAEALEGFLLALGVSAGRIPGRMDQRAALFRSLVSRRRMLLVLDNAVSSEQVRPLLPGAGPSRTLITSRRRLDGLAAREDAVLLAIEPLDPGHSRELLVAGGGTKLGDEGIDVVVEMCAGLPLALRIAATRLRGSLSARDLARRLSDERTRLSALSIEDDTMAVRAAFQVSYQPLPSPAARMFRLIGLHAGRTPSLSACAALAGLPVDEAHAQLDALVAAHLLREDSTDRVAMHDLVRVYAREQAEHDDRAANDEALRRALIWYLHASDAASQAAHPHPAAATRDLPPAVVPVPEFAGVPEAARWLDRELPNLTAMLEAAVEREWDDLAWRVVHAPSPLLGRRMERQRWITLAKIGHAAAVRAGARDAESFFDNAMGIAHALLQQYEEAEKHLRAAIRVRTEAGDIDSLLVSRQNLAALLGDMGQPEAAIAEFEMVVRIERERGSNARVPSALNNICKNLLRLNRAAEAVDSGLQASAAAAAQGDVTSEAYAHLHLTEACTALDRYAEAEEHCRRAVHLARMCGDLFVEASALQLHGDLKDQRGSPDEAHALWKRSAELFDVLDAADEAAAARARTAGTPVG